MQAIQPIRIHQDHRVAPRNTLATLDLSITTLCAYMGRSPIFHRRLHYLSTPRVNTVQITVLKATMPSRYPAPTNLDLLHTQQPLMINTATVGLLCQAQILTWPVTTTGPVLGAVLYTVLRIAVNTSPIIRLHIPFLQVNTLQRKVPLPPGQDWYSRRRYLNTHKPLHHQEEARGTYTVDIMADSIRTMRMNYLPVGIANIGSSKTRE